VSIDIFDESLSKDCLGPVRRKKKRINGGESEEKSEIRKEKVEKEWK